MVDLGNYPAVLDEPRGTIVGEVWSIDERDFAQLDELEDYPSLYTRRVIELASGGSAWMYVLHGAPEDHGFRGVDVPDRDYRRWLAQGD
ncbi:MAG: gamma-glutamylcyclotransferase (GGCT)/AIG2-like uncharacterized protein YtfP [Bradymonadia bacterium]|jgi:gamma-glutamylcyclotransferase (GGCT)/AIG2-like uncharacterized protein YtfP